MDHSKMETIISSEVGMKDDTSSVSHEDDAGTSLLETDYQTASRMRSLKDYYAKRIPSLYFYICITTINVVLFVVSGIMLLLSVGGDKGTLQDAWKATSFYSPIFERFEMPKITRTTNGTLFDTHPPSIWRARTGGKADAAWDRVGSKVPPIVMNADEVRAIGKDPETAVKFPEEYGYGPNAYIGTIEVFHHIHCLDKLRKEISYTHYWEKAEGPAPGRAMHEAHTSHCIDVLMQSLMCTGSVDIITFNWLEGRDMMFPDFENKKVCRDFDALRDWVEENGVAANETELKAMTPPAGAKRVSNPLRMSHHD